MSKVLILIVICVSSFTDAFAVATPEELEFIKQLKVASVKNDKEWIAENIFYPLPVYIKGNRLFINNKQDFIKNYEMIFNCNVKTALSIQSIHNLFINWQGIMIGDGQIWIDGRKENKDSVFFEIKIVAVNNL